jgi:hypothetical protein
MVEQFVTYEIAVALKELGFDEDCLAHYYGEYKDLMHCCENSMEGDFTVYNRTDSINAPLWQQVIDWFREKELSIDIYTVYGFSNPMYSFDIFIKNNIYHLNIFKIGGDKDYNKIRKQAILRAIKMKQEELCKNH